jgi:hypothetical protein
LVITSVVNVLVVVVVFDLVSSGAVFAAGAVVGALVVAGGLIGATAVFGVVIGCSSIWADAWVANRVSATIETNVM